MPTDRAGEVEMAQPPRSRLTFDRSPVRKSRTPGSARGAGGNSRSYRDRVSSGLRHVETGQVGAEPFLMDRVQFTIGLDLGQELVDPGGQLRLVLFNGDALELAT